MKKLYGPGEVRDRWGRKNDHDVFDATNVEDDELPEHYLRCDGEHDPEAWHEDDLWACIYGTFWCIECGSCAHPECHE